MMNYIPSLLMNIINQATNYITGDSKYDLIITVNITSMVVLATIYMSVSMSLPNTPDIKPVEVWLFFSIAYPFWVIITNVTMQVSLSFTLYIYFHLGSLNLRVLKFQAFDKGNKNVCNTHFSTRKVQPKTNKYSKLLQQKIIFNCFKIIATYINPALYFIFVIVYCVMYV